MALPCVSENVACSGEEIHTVYLYKYSVSVCPIISGLERFWEGREAIVESRGCRNS